MCNKSLTRRRNFFSGDNWFDKIFEEWPMMPTFYFDNQSKILRTKSSDISYGDKEIVFSFSVKEYDPDEIKVEVNEKPIPNLSLSCKKKNDERTISYCATVENGYDVKRASALLKDGVLTISVPKFQKAVSESIKIPIACSQ